MGKEKSFAEIVAETRAEPRPKREVRPGSFNRAGEFFDPAGNLLTKAGQLTPAQATSWVRRGALVAWEGCGCGGWSGCKPTWVDEDELHSLATGAKPRFTKRHGSPTWIDLWEGASGPIVFAHGDVEWGDSLS